MDFLDFDLRCCLDLDPDLDLDRCPCPCPEDNEDSEETDDFEVDRLFRELFFLDLDVLELEFLDRDLDRDLDP